jgi:hypothetical protein
VGAPVPLFDAHVAAIAAPDSYQYYDVTADGKRFLVNTNNLAASASPPLTVVVNWQAGLKK